MIICTRLKPLPNNLKVFTFCMLVIISLKIYCFKLIMLFNKFVDPVYPNCLDGCCTMLREDDIGYFLYIRWSGSCSTSVQRENPLYK